MPDLTAKIPSRNDASPPLNSQISLPSSRHFIAAFGPATTSALLDTPERQVLEGSLRIDLGDLQHAGREVGKDLVGVDRRAEPVGPLFGHQRNDLPVAIGLRTLFANDTLYHYLSFVACAGCWGK